MEWHKVTSSNVEAVAYEAAEEVAHVRFRGGAEYVYDGVTKGDFESLRDAPSVGAHLARVFKNKYAGRPDVAGAERPAPKAEKPRAADLDQRAAAIAELRARTEAVLRAAIAWADDDNAVCSTPEEDALLTAVIAYTALPGSLKPVPKTPTEA